VRKKSRRCRRTAAAFFLPEIDMVRVHRTTSKLKSLSGTKFDSDYCRLHQNVHGDTMSIWLEVNFALWVMIGCATEKAIQFIQYLN
jgi:hypothetical protein